MPPKTYVYTDELSQMDYEPCTHFVQVDPHFANLPVGADAMDAKVTMTRDGVTAGGRPRYRMMVNPA